MISKHLLAGIVSGTLVAFSPFFASAEVGDSAPAQVNDPWTASVYLALGLLDSGRDADLKRDHKAIEAFYKSRGFKAVWTDGSAFTPQARSVIARIRRAQEDGLDPQDYALPDSDIDRRFLQGYDGLAEAELQLSAAILTYARHASAGRINPNVLSRSVTMKPEKPDPMAVLKAMADSPRPDATLASYNPPHPEFRLLRDQLAELRRQDDNAEQPAPIPDGPTLRVGMQDERIVEIRRRVGAAMPDVDADIFDKDLKKDVRRFQREAGLSADGIIGKRTLAAMNGGSAENREEVVLANMEQWRWMPRDLGAFHVRVNVPEFMVRVMRNGSEHHKTRTIVGKRRNQTPIFSDEMDHVIVNPYWNVPLSITSKEMLPDIVRDPQGYFAKGNYEVLTSVSGRVRSVDPGQVDWRNVNLRKLHIRQRPGRGNALGRIKFMFPNKHSVYLHDTPTKHLFKRDFRAYSHGCMRVHKPIEFADALLVNEPNLSGSRIKSMFGGQEKRVNLVQKIPVHVTYFTAWVDGSGQLQTRKDLYGHHKRMMKCLELRHSGKQCGIPPKPAKYVPPQASAQADLPPEEEAGGFWSSGPAVVTRRDPIGSFIRLQKPVKRHEHWLDR